MENKVKVGDRILIHPWHTLFHSFHTRQWMSCSYGTVLKVNPKTITVRLDDYPEEKHYIDYGDFDIVNE